MFALVEDVERYPDFLPWCIGSTLHSKDDATIEASLELQRGGIRKTFRTRNGLNRSREMSIALVGGPFSHLDGNWTFEQLGDDGSKVSLLLEFEFENRVTDVLFGRYFEDTCNSLIESFIARAQKIYGAER